MNYIKITENDIANGPGVRVTLWVAGCDHQCEGCHNPQTWDKKAGMPFTTETKIKLLRLLSKGYIQGLTVSGGDPFFIANRDELISLLCLVRKTLPAKDIWVWTGYLWEEVKELSAMQYIDVLVDGPFIQEQKDITLVWKGSKNQRVIDVKKSLQSNQVILYQ